MEPVSGGHSKKTQIYVIKTDNRSMQVKGIAECNKFDIHNATKATTSVLFMYV